MRQILGLLLPSLLSAAALAPNPPRPDPPRLFLPQLKSAPAHYWNAAKAVPKGDPRDSLGPLQPLGRPRLDLPLLPYPDQAPARARGYLAFQ